MRRPDKTEYTSEEILKLVKSLIGETSPFGNTTFDNDVVIPNIEVLGEVTVSLVTKLSDIEENKENQLISLDRVGKKAESYMNVIREIGVFGNEN